MTKIKLLGLALYLIFGLALNAVVHLFENPFGFLLVAILFTVESIRSYYEGLLRGAEILKGIK